ncbi:MAG: hypothetical protein AAGB29_09665 [Planctomycetota bacterium]
MSPIARRACGNADLLLAVALYAVVWWWLGTLPAPMQLDFDEGIQVGKGLLVQDGWRIHDDVWSDQPPLMSHYLAWWHRSGLGQGWGGDVDPLVEGRRMVALFAIGGLVLVGRLTRRMVLEASGGKAGSGEGGSGAWGWAVVAGLIAMVLVLGGRRYARLGVSAMVGIPAIVTALLAVWVAWGPRDEKAAWRWVWLVISGLLFAAALQVKLFVFMLIPATLGLVAWREWVDATTRGRSVRAFGGPVAWLAALAVGFALVAEALGWLTVAQNVAPHMAEVGEGGGELVASVVDNVYRIGQLLLEDALLVAWAAIGVVMAVQRRRWAWVAWPGAWAAASVIALLFADPLQSHHRLMFTIPLAMIAAAGMVELARRVLEDRAAGKASWRPIGVGGGALAAAAIGLALARPISLGVGLGRTQGEVLDAEVVAAIDAEVAQGGVQWVYMDKLTYACAADLRTPPELAVVSAKRRRNGDITDEMIAEVIESRGVDLVLLARFDYKRKHPVMQVVRESFELILERDGVALYRRSPSTAPGSRG